MGYEHPAKITSPNTENTLLSQAIKTAKELNHIHAAILQRKLCIGYSKAKSLINAMLEGGYIIQDETKSYNSYLSSKI